MINLNIIYVINFNYDRRILVALHNECLTKTHYFLVLLYNVEYDGLYTADGACVLMYYLKTVFNMFLACQLELL